MENQNILKRTLPFLFLFVFSVLVASNEYVKQISAPTQAADESVAVEIANVAAPLEENSTWKWNAIIYVDSYFKQPIQANYEAYWCKSTQAKKIESERKSCSPMSDPAEFRETLKSGAVAITTREMTAQLESPSVPCGRVEIRVMRNTELLGSAVKDTGVSCLDTGFTGEETNLQEESDGTVIKQMIVRFLGIFMGRSAGTDEGDTSGGSSGGEDPGGGAEDPSNPSSELPITCGENGQAGSIIGWGGCIVPHLEKGLWNYYNRMMADINNGSGYSAAKRPGSNEGNIYWCTNLIIDSFSLELKPKGIGSLPSQLSVVAMRKFFDGNGDYTYIDYRQPDVAERRAELERVRPGYAVFFMNDYDNHREGGQHVALVAGISIDSHCDGKLSTIDSNNKQYSNTYTISGCEIKLDSRRPVMAFAGYNE